MVYNRACLLYRGMIHIIYFFDEYDDFYRNPQGAVCMGDSLRIRIMAQTGGASRITLVFFTDDGETFETRMRVSEIRGRCDVF